MRLFMGPSLKRTGMQSAGRVHFIKLSNAALNQLTWCSLQEVRGEDDSVLIPCSQMLPMGSIYPPPGHALRCCLYSCFDSHTHPGTPLSLHVSHAALFTRDG